MSACRDRDGWIFNEIYGSAGREYIYAAACRAINVG